MSTTDLVLARYWRERAALVVDVKAARRLSSECAAHLGEQDPTTLRAKAVRAKAQRTLDDLDTNGLLLHGLLLMLRHRVPVVGK